MMPTIFKIFFFIYILMVEFICVGALHYIHLTSHFLNKKYNFIKSSSTLCSTSRNYNDNAPSNPLSPSNNGASSYRKPLIEPQASSSGLRELQERDKRNPLQRALDQNWQNGLCKHKVTFESTEIIRRLCFHDDLLSFGLIDGRVCLVKISTHEVLDKYSEHASEVTSLDFNGEILCSGSAEGEVNMYALTLSGSKKFGRCLLKLKHHTRAVSGLKIFKQMVRRLQTVPSSALKKDNEVKALQQNDDPALIISCGMDRKLVAVDTKR